jgi:hypothetical protein
MGVSIRLKIGNFEVVTDTPEEAAKMMTLFDPDLVTAPRESDSPRILSTEWTPQLWEAFRELIKEQPLQKQLLNTLFARGTAGVLKEELVKELKLTNPKQLAGPFSGVAKYAKKLGLAREAVYKMEKIQIDGKRTYRYFSNQSARTLAIMRVRNKAESAREMPELRDYIRSKRQVLAAFMEQGAGLALDGDLLTVTARNDVYIRYLNDNKALIAELAGQFFSRNIRVEMAVAK